MPFWTATALFYAAWLVLAAMPSASVTAATLGSQPIFGVVGRRYSDFKPIPQWETMLERYRVEEEKDARCREGKRGNCPYTEWKALIDRVKYLDRTKQIEEVNSFANRWRYVSDRANWGVKDYWETPGEFFVKSGDCEDYAIVKFMSLRALGFGNDDLLLVAVKDENLGVGHAVTLVEVQGQTLLLDNQLKSVIPASRVRHYQPVFAANELTWWLYRPH